MKTKEQLLHITSGRGPAECAWVVTKVLSKLITELKNNGIDHEVIYRENGIETGTLTSVSIKICGQNAEKCVNNWQGTIQWTGQSPFRKFHKRKNWFIGISARPIGESAQLLERDISYQTLRSGGPGGQHVNKVATAVRVVHKPSGLTVTASDTRSQMQNKKLAIQRLKELHQKNASEAILKEQQDTWNNHNSLARGNPVKIFKGKEFIEQNLKKQK